MSNSYHVLQHKMIWCCIHKICSVILYCSRNKQRFSPKWHFQIGLCDEFRPCLPQGASIYENTWDHGQKRGERATGKRRINAYYNHQGVQMTNEASIQLYTVWKAGEVYIATKLRIFESSVTFVLLYGYKPWKVTPRIANGLQIFINKP